MRRIERDGKRKRDQEKIYCANCSYCVLFKKPVGDTGAYVLRVRCSKGMWKKRSGEEKVYKYFTLIRRTMATCPHYDPMGEVIEYIQELRKNLPVKDEIYTY